MGARTRKTESKLDLLLVIAQLVINIRKGTIILSFLLSLSDGSMVRISVRKGCRDCLVDKALRRKHEGWHLDTQKLCQEAWQVQWPPVISAPRRERHEISPG